MRKLITTIALLALVGSSVAIAQRARSSTNPARSPARVSKKREYFPCGLETIGDFAPKLFKWGV